MRPALTAKSGWWRTGESSCSAAGADGILVEPAPYRLVANTWPRWRSAAPRERCRPCSSVKEASPDGRQLLHGDGLFISTMSSGGEKPRGSARTRSLLPTTAFRGGTACATGSATACRQGCSESHHWTCALGGGGKCILARDTSKYGNACTFTRSTLQNLPFPGAKVDARMGFSSAYNHGLPPGNLADKLHAGTLPYLCE